MDIELERIEVGDDEQSDTFQNIVAFMIAIVSLVGAVVAWQSTLADPDDADRGGLQATLNAETTRFFNSAVLYKRYRAYTTYTLNDELQHQIEADLADTAESEQPELLEKQIESLDLAATSQLFFPSRYLNRDGSYNTSRDLGEAWAQAEQMQDLNAQTHFEDADGERVKIIVMVVLIIQLTIALLLYTLAEGLHPDRKWLRYGTAFGGTLFLIISVAGAISMAGQL